MTYSFDLDMTPGGVPNMIRLSRFDKATPVLQFILWDGATAYIIPAGSTVFIAGTKPDHTGFEYYCEFSGSTVTVEPTEQMTAVAGRTVCEIVIYHEGERKGSANFYLDIEPSALEDNIVLSETDIPIIQQLPEIIGELDDTVKDCEAWARGTRGGEDVPPTDQTFHNNSKYYSEQADALGEAQAQNAEAWANGKKDGQDVPSTDPAYQNNAKYYAMLAASYAGAGLHPQIVQTLPVVDIQTNVMYFVPTANPSSGNLYDEYINTDGTTQGWEMIGSTAIDMSAYYTSTQVDTLLSTKQNSTDNSLNTTSKQIVGAINELEARPVSSANEADTYDATSTYVEGDNVLHNGNYYECNTDISTPEAWNATHWTQKKIGNQISQINADLSDLMKIEVTQTETLIGKFGNDDLYRRVYTLTNVPVVYGSGTTIDASLNVAYVKNLVRLYGSGKMNYGPILPLNGSSVQVAIHGSTTGLNVVFAVSGGSYVIQNGVLIVEYTKN